MQKVSIVIPVFNERKTIEELIARVEGAPILGLEKEIVLVDDGSTDGTRDILKNMEKKHRVVYHQKNQGKGAALRTGFREATGDIILVQDADFEYDPQEFPKLLEPLLKGEADIVYGSRNMHNNPRFRKSYYWGSIIISKLTNLFYGCHLTDVYTCYKAFKAPILKAMKLESNGFDIEEELTAKALKSGHKIIEVPINYYPRNIEEGKKIRPKDGLIALWKILKYRFTN